MEEVVQTQLPADVAPVVIHADFCSWIASYGVPLCLVPMWLIQFVGCVSLTFGVMGFIKQFWPLTWTPYRRRKTNLALSFVVGAGVTFYFYDQQFPQFVVCAVAVMNHALYSGLKKYIGMQAQKKNGWWMIAYSVLCPHIKTDNTPGAPFELGQTVVNFKPQKEDKENVS